MLLSKQPLCNTSPFLNLVSLINVTVTFVFMNSYHSIRLHLSIVCHQGFLY